jgi:hypothetical protein
MRRGPATPNRGPGAAGRPAPSSSPRKPSIVWDPIPFGPLRKAQMVAYHHVDVAALRTQTHSDFDQHDMQIYRAGLRQLGGC